MDGARRPWWLFAALVPYLLHLAVLLDARFPGPGPPGWDLRYSAAGLRVAHVQPGSPATRAGIQADDVLVALDGIPASRALGGLTVRRHHRVDFLRGGVRRHARIALERRPWSDYFNAPKLAARLLPVLSAVFSVALGLLIVFGQPFGWVALGFAWPLLAAPAAAGPALAGLPEAVVLLLSIGLFAANAGALPGLLTALAAFSGPVPNRHALWLFWIPSLAMAPVAAWRQWLALGTPAALEGPSFFHAASRALIALYVVAALLTLVQSYGSLSAHRRSARLLLTGQALVLLSYLVPVAISGAPTPDRSLLRLLQLAWALYPIQETLLTLRIAGLLAMAYAVIRYRPFDFFAARTAPSLARFRGWILPTAQVAGLLATGWLVWYSSLLPRLRRSSLGDLLAEALGYALLAWAWSAAIALCLYFTLPKTPRAGAFNMALRVSITAIWFAPATTLLSTFSPVSMAAALVLVVSATRLLYFHWRLLWPEPAHASAPSPFRAPGAVSLRQLAPKLIASAALQGGAVAILMRYPLSAAALLALSLALLTLLWEMNVGTAAGRPQTLPRSVLGVALTIVLAAGLTVGGLAGYPGSGQPGWRLTPPSRPGVWETARSLLDSLLGDDAPPQQPVAARAEPARPDPADLLDDTYPGVILWPETRPHVTVVAPLPAFATHGASAAARPFGIPFSGEYWIYTPPFLRPPEKSLVSRGSPVRLAYLTRDRRPMRMEARHHLDDPIALRCCSAIRLEIRSADRYPGTVSLELVLVNSLSPRDSVSLGRLPVTAFPDPRSEPATPVAQILDFPVPASAAIAEFDTFKIVFHRQFDRAHRSARISIERLVLLPRG